jgi:hypothetical protein
VVELDWLVSHRYPLSESAAAFASAARRDGLKTVIEVEAPADGPLP